MAASTGKAKCIKCGKDKATAKCEGCAQDFCFKHLGEHRQELSKQLDGIQVDRDVFRETLNQQTNQAQKHPLIQQINQWEQESIEKIKQKAEEARQSVLKRLSENSKKLEEQLNELTNHLRQGQEEDDVNEIDLQKWKNQLTELTEQFTKPSGLLVRRTATPLINYIDVDAFSQINLSNIPVNAKWRQNGFTIAGGNGQGSDLNQLNSPFGICVDDDETIYIADYRNHRIVEWKKGATTGQVVAGGNGKGNQNNQLNRPWNVIIDKQNDCLIISDEGNSRVMRWSRQNGTNGETIISDVDCRGLAMDNNGYVYVSDDKKHEVRRWKIGEKEGTLVAGGNGQGNRLDQLSCPFYIFVDEDQSVYVSDHSNHRVTKWVKDAKEGIVVAGGQGSGNSLTQLSYPMGIVVDQHGTVYVGDNNNHRVMRWLKGAKEGSVVGGGNSNGTQTNQLNVPAGLSFDRQNNIYVVDRNNFRIQKFNIIS